KAEFPPVSLPTREYMERARKLWDELGMPELKYGNPWHGYSLGLWPAELDDEAALAVRGEHHRIGAKLDERAVPVAKGERLQDVQKRWKPE
ncbi:MAG: hypothetical protein OXU42_19140, partial [Deltaproteobacteria bacterium]|nr:hypothetical protein [Deltaproteobacteria bacterium]